MCPRTSGIGFFKPVDVLVIFAREMVGVWWCLVWSLSEDTHLH